METTQSTSETGHAINVANFETLITACLGHGAIYNPVNTAIQVPQLQAKLLLAQQKLNTTALQKSILNTAINERIEAFKGLEVLCTQVTNAFAVSGATDLDVSDLQTINKKIQGAKQKKATPTPENPTPLQVSNSQQSYDSKINFFTNFIQFVETKPIYSPNETTLSVATLQSKLAEMILKNQRVDVATFDYNQSLNARNDEFYNPTSGLVQLSKDIKKYAKSIFGAASPSYKQINSIEFKAL
ncbi:hypothetical protein [Flavobacterium sp.]|uniref:hypothetical protein n=1 Tax=Flavobacterium sp. TaxID=239 RepID=UPI003919D293